MATKEQIESADVQQFKNKISYLQSEIQQLKNEKKSLEIILTKNREKIVCTINSTFNSNNQNKQLLNADESIKSQNNMQFQNNPEKNSFIQFDSSKICNISTSQNYYKSNFINASPKSFNNHNKTCQIILEQAFQENDKLYQMIEQLTRERDQAQAKVLIYEQIADSSQKEEREFTYELNTQIKKLMTQNQQLQNQIKVFEQRTNQNFDDKDGKEKIIFRDREILQPKSDIIKLTMIQEVLKDILTNLINENKKLKEQKGELLNLNSILSRQVSQLQKQIISNQQGDIQNQQNLNEQLKFLEMQEQIFSGRSIDQENEFYDDMLSTRVKNIKPPEISKEVPKIDITKAKKVQEIAFKKQQEQKYLKEIQQQKSQMQLQQGPSDQNHGPWQQKQHGGNLKQKTDINKQNEDIQDISKFNQNQQTNDLVQQLYQQQTLDQKLLVETRMQIEQLENELYKSRRIIQELIINEKIAQEKISELEGENIELQSRNQTLIESNKNYEQKWKKYYYSFQFYRNFFISQNYKAVSQKSSNQSNQQTILNLFGDAQYYQQKQLENMKLQEDVYFNPDSIQRFIKRSSKIKGSPDPQLDKSIQDLGEDFGLLSVRCMEQCENQLVSNQQQFENAKNYLKKLAKELYSNKAIRDFFWNNMSFKKKRSYSQPIIDDDQEKVPIYSLKYLKKGNSIFNQYLNQQKEREFYSKCMKEINQLEELIQLDDDKNNHIPQLANSSFILDNSQFNKQTHYQYFSSVADNKQQSL